MVQGILGPINKSGAGGGGGGDVTNAANLGGEEEVFISKVGTILNFRTFQGLGNLIVQENGDLIRIDGSAKADFIINIIREPAAGPLILAYGAGQTKNMYIATGGINQQFLLPLGAAVDDGKEIIVKSYNSFVGVTPQPGDLLELAPISEPIPTGESRTFIYDHDGGVQPSWWVR